MKIFTDLALDALDEWFAAHPEQDGKPTAAPEISDEEIPF
jgi:hypothetical protein